MTAPAAALRRAVFGLLPHRALSALALRLGRIEWPPAKNLLVALYRRLFPVRMDEACEENPERYPTLDAFFTRALKPEARPWPERAGFACPCDCLIGAHGGIEDGLLIQAKRHRYSAAALLGSAADAQRFAGGLYATLYLSPSHCHRVFAPQSGTRTLLRHIPGRQRSVAPWAAEGIPGLYARNERVVSLFEDDDGAAFAVVMVGALHVASIEIAGHGLVTPRSMAHGSWPAPGPARFARGDEIGRFHLGSTVVALSARRDWQWDAEVAADQFRAYGRMLFAPPGA